MHHKKKPALPVQSILQVVKKFKQQNKIYPSIIKSFEEVDVTKNKSKGIFS